MITQKIISDKLDHVSRNSFVKFSAKWCQPCKIYVDNFEKFAEKYQEKYDFYDVDIEENPNLTVRFGIRSVPTTIVIDEDGEELERLMGVQTVNTLQMLVK